MTNEDWCKNGNTIWEELGGRDPMLPVAKPSRDGIGPDLLQNQRDPRGSMSYDGNRRSKRRLAPGGK